jgi:hypothetical protein
MKRLIVLGLIVACGGKKDEPARTAAGSSGSGGSGGSAEVAKAPTPVVEKSPYCGAKPCPCAPDTKEKPGEWDHPCELTVPTVVQGVPCDHGLLEFYPDGKIKQCQQDGTAYTIDGVTCKGNWHINFHPNGKLARCAGVTPMTIGPYNVSGPNLALFSDGSLANADISGEVDVGGIKCQHSVLLYPGGTLQRCWLAAPVTKAGVSLQANDSITLRPNGKLKSMSFNRKDGTIDGKPVAATKETCFDENEKPLEKAPEDCNTMVGEMAP